MYLHIQNPRINLASKLFALSTSIILSSIFFHAQAQNLERAHWKFITGDRSEYALPAFDDSKWREIKVAENWEAQGYAGYDGYAWYRVHLFLPALKSKSGKNDTLALFLGKIDDHDRTFLNGTLIGEDGDGMDQNTKNKDNSSGSYVRERRYLLSAANPAIHWGADNVIAIQVHDTGGEGGLYEGPYGLRLLDLSDKINLLSDANPWTFRAGLVSRQVVLENKSDETLHGTWTTRVVSKGKELQAAMTRKPVNIAPHGSLSLAATAPGGENTQLLCSFSEPKLQRAIEAKFQVPYLLTPAVKPAPQLNSPHVYGARVGMPFLFYIPLSGIRPMQISVTGLPEGIVLDSKTGILSGSCKREGSYPLTVQASNKAGKTSGTLRIVIGDKIGLTPAMGWNSWNAFGLSVSSEKVRQAARAFVDKGLRDQGYSYINIDDGWEDSIRDAAGKIRSNSRFPSMQSLTTEIHRLGLKAGLYSSPGPLTCGGFLGSWQHENQDARSYADWEFDYLKYDWCSYGGIDTTNHKVLENYTRPYLTMQKALASSGRDIYYSLCQYGMGDVWRWGASVGGNSWRTTGDIGDSWKSMSSIAFHQDTIASWSKPGGGWNDPDMLIVGQVGWGPKLHATHLSPDEQYTHISLWSLQSAPLLIGCDMNSLDAFTLNLLSNDEVIAIDQDELGRPAAKKLVKADYQVWVKELADGSRAAGIFNLSDTEKSISFNWEQAGIKNPVKVRDVWRQKNMPELASGFTAAIPAHGVRLLRLTPRGK